MGKRLEGAGKTLLLLATPERIESGWRDGNDG
jgi:hypothetical protein